MSVSKAEPRNVTYIRVRWKQQIILFVGYSIWPLGFTEHKSTYYELGNKILYTYLLTSNMITG